MHLAFLLYLDLLNIPFIWILFFFLHLYLLSLSRIKIISVILQSCLNRRKSINGERYIYVGDDNTVELEAIENFRLLLKTEFYLDLNETFIVPSF